MVAKYCIGCHNTRNPLPAGAPLALDKVNYADPAADAATWERVIKKLGVGAMPPQGSPTPGHAELNRFRASIIASLDAAAAGKVTPGRFVLHRLNRLEYQNAVRDLLGVTGEPVLARVHRQRRAMPQYAPGHLARVAAIERRLPALAGLHLAGAAYRGVGIPDCIRSGEAAADAALERRAT